ncbi:transport and Golgi organization protein 1 homolog [Thalassophryne amazonica]|uniref:transport and Golgi organization protein 1 homolog n=1 Tax=Thalassophryne amazonica TaxID=390379 RepID=UPI0014726A79|nr:transport and Golgi organization protein 1 homolog [Thalassophryne amazonica]
MAAKHFSRRRCFFLLCFHVLAVAALEKRFSDFKRCADEECSNLLIRGKATADFSGPDCRFLSFKKSETVFVYYKLSGRRADMWAGSVGSHFGYFPKDLLVVNHIYTHKELEVPTEETDFVCFETGYDKFDNYDIDLLLGSAKIMVENADKNTATSGHTQMAEATLNESKSSAGEKTQSRTRSDFSDKSEPLDGTPDRARASLSQLDVASESLTTVAQSDAAIEGGVEDLNKQKASEEMVLKNGDEKHETIDDTTVPEELLDNDNSVNESFSVSERMQIPKLKTTLGTTFDVISDDGITRKVTPYEEEERDQLENHPEEDHDVQKGTPLLSFFEQTADTTLTAKETESNTGTEDAREDEDSEQKSSEVVDKNSDQMVETSDSNAVPEVELLDKDNLVTERVSVYEGAQIPKLKTTLGTTFDAVVTDDEITQKVTPYEEEEGEQLESPPEEDNEVPKGTPLLPFFKETVDITLTDPAIPDARKDKDNEQETSEEVVDKNHYQKTKTSDTNAAPKKQFLDKDNLVTERVSVCEGVQIPKLKTTLGTTFDAVITDDEITQKVTPYEEEESKQLESPPEEDHEVPKGTPLLPFFEETADITLTDPTIVDGRKDEDNEQETSEEVVDKINYQKIKTSDTNAVPEKQFLDKDNLVTERVSVYEGVQIPKLKTTLGTTFDAVVTDDEITQKVTPYEEEESEQLESPPEEDHEVQKGTPLLSFFEERASALVSDSFIKQDNQHVDEAQTIEDKNTGISLDEAKSSVIREGEKTTEDPVFKDTDVKVEEDVSSEAFQSLDEVKHDIQVAPLEYSKVPDDREQIVKDPLAVGQSDKFVFDETDREVTRQQESQKAQEALKATDKQMYHKAGMSTSVDSALQDDSSAKLQNESLDTETTDESTEEDVSKEPPFSTDDAYAPDSGITMEHTEDLDKTLEESTVTAQDEFRLEETESNQEKSVKELNPDVTVEHTEDLDKTSEKSTVGQDQLATTEMESNQEEPVKENLGFKVNGDKLADNYITKKSESSDTMQSKPESSVKETELLEDHHTEENVHEKDTEGEEEEEKEELLEDENAVSFSQSHQLDTDQSSPTSPPRTSTSESQYSDSVIRLTLLRGHFTDQTMKRLQTFLGLKNLFKVESMFSDLEAEFQTVHFSHSGNTQDVENALESILEASEDSILHEIKKMLVNKTKDGEDYPSNSDEDEILDEFQELAFSLHQKYSAASDGTHLPTEKTLNITQDDDKMNVEAVSDNLPETEGDGRITQTQVEENPMEIKVDQMMVDEIHSGSDVSVADDSGQFNRNKDNQPGFSAPDEVKEPETNLENPLDMGLGVEAEHLQLGSLDSLEPGSDVHEEYSQDFLSTGIAHIISIITVIKTKLAEWTAVVISLLPEEWKPGEMLFGCPWHAVVITALVGVVTFALFFWRTVLAVKKREYLVDEKRLKEQIQALKDEKKNALTKISELQKQSEKLKKSQKESEETISCTTKRLQELERKVLEAEMQNKKVAKEKNSYTKLLEEERVISRKNETKFENLEKSIEKLQFGKKKIQETLAKTTVLLDEAKIREEARNAQHKSLKKDHEVLKTENKTLKDSIKGWEDKHKELSEQIKVYQNSQKELEDSVVLKDHNVEVLSELLSDLDVCDMQKGGSVLENGEVAPDKKTTMRNRIKQMMDVSRVQTTLAVVEEERDRFMTKLLAAEKTRKALEEQHQELEHAIAALKREKSHMENQFNILQQKNEIMVEMYQQKENALQQKLTKEELERRSRESLLSEVGGKALEAEEQVKVLRQRINEMEEQMKKTEEVYKEQIKEQENKTHSNWVNARNAERALNQEKAETSKLREKLAVLTAQLNDRRAPLFRPNSGQPPGPRQGDSYGPSPVSGGAPSPPVMIEGPRRPPSAPVGRRIDPYGPRPPSDPHGRYPDNTHMPGMDRTGPRSSSPANMDGLTGPVEPQIKAETQAEASTESPEPGPGSFIASPIRDSSGSMVQGPPAGTGPHDPLLPPGPSRLPPPGPYRLPRPSPYPLPPGMAGPHGPLPPHGPPLPANGHPGMPLPAPTNGHIFLPRPGPGHPFDPRGPPPPHFRPPPPPRFGLMPPQGARGSVGPRPPVPPDARFLGQRDQVSVPTGGPPHPAQVPADGPQSTARPHDSGQDPALKQEAVPANLARPAMVKP